MLLLFKFAQLSFTFGPKAKSKGSGMKLDGLHNIILLLGVALVIVGCDQEGSKIYDSSTIKSVKEIAVVSVCYSNDLNYGNVRVNNPFVKGLIETHARSFFQNIAEKPLQILPLKIMSKHQTYSSLKESKLESVMSCIPELKAVLPEDADSLSTLASGLQVDATLTVEIALYLGENVTFKSWGKDAKDILKHVVPNKTKTDTEGYFHLRSRVSLHDKNGKRIWRYQGYLTSDYFPCQKTVNSAEKVSNFQG